jgi:hypothetical protein
MSASTLFIVVVQQWSARRDTDPGTTDLLCYCPMISGGAECVTITERTVRMQNRKLAVWDKRDKPNHN